MFQPQKLGRYVLARKIATGGMAEIFLAKLLGAEGFEKEIVIKKILPQWSSDKDFISMLIDEAKIAVQLNHPNIIQVYELAREGEAYYIAMEYLNGVDLKKVIQKAHAMKRKIPVDICLTIASEVLEGLAYAHSKKDPRGNPLGIVHRDISPQNVLVSYDGTVKLTDFGIAKAASRSHETVAGVLKGKFAYMSPEQANQEDLDHRSDLFSAAIVLYELLTGDRLFYRGSDIETLDRVRRGQVSFSPEAEKIVSGRLREILLKALAKDRDGRFTDASDFREEILKFAQRTKRPLRRDKLARFITALFGDEIQGELEENTRLLTQATALLTKDNLRGMEDETRTVNSEEVFVQGADPIRQDDIKTVLATREGRSKPTPVFQRKIPPEFLASSLILIFGVIMIALIYSRQPRKIEVLPVPAEPVPIVVEAKKNGPPEVPAPISETQTVSAMPVLPPPKPAGIDRQEMHPKDVKKTEVVARGFLSVQAIPWGYVTIDGMRRKETPIRRVPLKVGRHRVEIYYEPDGSRATSNVQLVQDRETVCIVNFRGNKEIRCGN